MAIGIENFPQINPADADYLSGDIKDQPSGTPINRLTNGDIQQFFRKLLRLANITPNGTRDNESNGFQTIEALYAAGKPYREYVAQLTQSGTGDPTVNFVIRNEIGTIVWTRNIAGLYLGTLVGAFTADKTVATVSVVNNNRVAASNRLTDDGITLNTADFAGAGADVWVVYVSIRVYI